jgi:hypothetical protein
MIITSKMVLPLTVFRKNKSGKEIRETIMLRPGRHSYQNVNHKDPRVAEQLRVLRKHTSRNGVWFDELLPSDVELMSKMKGTPEEKAAAIRSETTSPIRKIVRHAERAATNESEVQDPEKDDGKSKSSRKVSDKK